MDGFQFTEVPPVVTEAAIEIINIAAAGCDYFNISEVKTADAIGKRLSIIGHSRENGS